MASHFDAILKNHLNFIQKILCCLYRNVTIIEFYFRKGTIAIFILHFASKIQFGKLTMHRRKTCAAVAPYHIRLIDAINRD